MGGKPWDQGYGKGEPPCDDIVTKEGKEEAPPVRKPAFALREFLRRARTTGTGPERRKRLPSRPEKAEAPARMKMPLLCILAAAAAPLTASLLRADTVTLKNGDRISGTIIEESAAKVVIESPVFGLLEVPESEVASTETDPGDSTAAPPRQPVKSLSEQYWERLTDRIFPEGFSGEITIGYAHTRTSDTESGVALGLSGIYEVGRHTVDANAFYEYTRKESASGEVTKPTDKYGAGAAYEFDVRKPFFLSGSDRALVDRVKRIDLQNDLNLLLGWRALEEEDYSLDLAVGPGVRYLKTSSADGGWDPLVTVSQDAFYRFNQSVRFEEEIIYSVDPTDTGSYSLLFEVSASIRLTPFAEPKLIYRNSYDSTVGEGGVRREESFLLALAVPF